MSAEVMLCIARFSCRIVYVRDIDTRPKLPTPASLYLIVDVGDQVNCRPAGLTQRGMLFPPTGYLLV